MNVVCGQCGTGYEFDDALVSERGTTVRCMHCGHQFRVHPDRSKQTGPERWIVRKANGEEYIFRTLSELQKAIAQRRVLVTDALSRDGVRYRPMSELSELESFFSPKAPTSGGPPGRPGADASVRGAAEAMSITPTAAISVPVPTPRGGFTTASTQVVDKSTDAAVRQSGLTQPTGFVHPAALAAAAARPGVEAPAAVSPRAAAPSAKPEGARPPQVAKPRESTPRVEDAPLVARAAPAPVGFVEAPTLASEPQPRGGAPADNRGAAASLPRRRRSARQSNPSIEDSTLLAAGVSEPSSSHVPEPLAVSSEQRSGGPRWIVALVLLGGLALVAGTVGRDYFERFRETRTVAPPTDDRVEVFLGAGDELYRAGDLEEARAQYEKASALADRNPAVLQRLLQVETTRADLDWLRLKVLPASSPEAAAAGATLTDRLPKVQRRMTEFQASAASAPTLEGIAALVDALRVQGQVAAARALVQQASGLGNDATSAYVSAMLDVSDASPNWSSIVSRLKLAVSAERGLGRAQAALVYALVSAGELQEAEQQLQVLASFKHQSPLLVDLRGYLAARVAASPPPAKGATAAESAPTLESPQGRGAKATDEAALRSENPMADAAAARAAGELSRAARLYTLALSKEPSNVAAMTGLGDVARSQGNADIALSHYGAALRTNPNYGPAILSCADLKWATGDRAGAVQLYRRLGAGAPDRVAQRIAEYENGTTSSAQREAVQPAPPESGAEPPPAGAGPETPSPSPEVNPQP